MFFYNRDSADKALNYVVSAKATVEEIPNDISKAKLLMESVKVDGLEFLNNYDMRKEFTIFKWFIALCQKHWIPEGNDGYWQEVVKDVSKFNERFGNSKFATDLTVALFEELERKHKKGVAL